MRPCLARSACRSGSFDRGRVIGRNARTLSVGASLVKTRRSLCAAAPFHSAAVPFHFAATRLHLAGSRFLFGRSLSLPPDPHKQSATSPLLSDAAPTVLGPGAIYSAPRLGHCVDRSIYSAVLPGHSFVPPHVPLMCPIHAGDRRRLQERRSNLLARRWSISAIARTLPTDVRRVRRPRLDLAEVARDIRSATRRHSGSPMTSVDSPKAPSDLPGAPSDVTEASSGFPRVPSDRRIHSRGRAENLSRHHRCFWRGAGHLTRPRRD